MTSAHASSSMLILVRDIHLLYTVLAAWRKEASHPHRLVFEPNHRPLPRKDGGGIDTEQVTAITILDVIDYH